MKHVYRTMTAICLFSFMTTLCNAEDIQHVAPPVTQSQPKSKDTGMQHDMGGMGMGMHQGMGMNHNMGGGMGMGMHHGMGGMMGAMMMGMSDEDKDKHMRSMQDHMLKMHDLSSRILAEKDSAKKEQLKNEQLQLMKAHHAEMMARHQAQPATAAPAANK